MIAEIEIGMHQGIKNLLRLIRDSLIVLGLFLAGSLWFTLVWPKMAAFFGMLMVLGAVAGAARINVEPFSYLGFIETYRNYFPSNIAISDYRHVGCVCFRFGIINFIIPAIFFIPILIIVSDPNKDSGYAIIVIILGVISIIFLVRGILLLGKSNFYKYFGR